MNLTLKHFDLDANTNAQKDFFDYCFKNKLFQENSEFKSRIKSVLKNETSNFGIKAIIGYVDDAPIGMIFLEKPENTTPFNGFEINNQRFSKKNEYDFEFDYLGFFNIYIKEQYRNNNFTDSLVSDFLDAIDFYKYDYSKKFPLITAKDAAFDIINDLTDIKVIKTEPYQSSFNNDISNLTKRMISNDEVDDVKIENNNFKEEKVVVKKFRQNM